MANIVLQSNNSGSGSLTLVGPDTNSNLIVNIAAAAGTVSPLVLGTPQTATGTTVQFSNLPSWVNRITISVIDIDFAALTGGCQIRLGTGGTLATTGYLTTSSIGGTHTRNTSGLGGFATNTTTVAGGSVVIVHVGNNKWVSQGITARYSDTQTQVQAGAITLAGPLDTIGLVATTSTFVSGTINILYE